MLPKQNCTYPFWGAGQLNDHDSGPPSTQVSDASQRGKFACVLDIMLWGLLLSAHWASGSPSWFCAGSLANLLHVPCRSVQEPAGTVAKKAGILQADF